MRKYDPLAYHDSYFIDQRQEKIHWMRSRGATFEQIGRKFGVSGTTISDIIRRIERRHGRLAKMNPAPIFFSPTEAQYLLYALSGFVLVRNDFNAASRSSQAASRVAPQRSDWPENPYL